MDNTVMNQNFTSFIFFSNLKPVKKKVKDHRFLNNNNLTCFRNKMYQLLSEYEYVCFSDKRRLWLEQKTKHTLVYFLGYKLNKILNRIFESHIIVWFIEK